MRSIAGIALACALVAAQANARPFTVEDLLSLQDFGRAVFSPDGRWLVVERYGRWRDAPTFQHEWLTHATTSRLLVFDLGGSARRAPSGGRPLLAPDDKAGDEVGAFSPDGRKVLVFRLKDRRREMGVVTLASGAVAWSGVKVEPEKWAASARWRNDDEVVAIARDPDTPSNLLGSGWQTQARTTAAWDAHGRGEASGVVFGSGRYANLNPAPALARLVAFDSRSGAVRSLAQGAFVDLLVAPGGHAAALASEGALNMPGATDRLMTTPPRQRGLVTIDLDTGARQTPCGSCNLAPGVWAWSRDGQSLAFAARTTSRIDAPFGYWRTSLGRPAERLAPELDLPVLVGQNERRAVGQIVWLGGAPTLLARANDTARTDWWRLTDKGPKALTARSGAAPRRALAADPAGLLVQAGDAIVRLTPQGEVEPVAPSAAEVLAAPTLPGVTSGTALATLGAAPRLISAGGAQRPAGARPPGAEILALSARGDVVATTKTAHGVATLWLSQPGQPPHALATINDTLADVAFATAEPIAHNSASGERVTSWLYRPSGPPPPGGWPVVVIPYPGDRRAAPPAAFAPGAVSFESNPQLMVAHGLAVIAPSLPLATDADPGAGLAAAMLLAVDAALAADPDLSADKLAIWGQSFGGWGALMAGTQSTRFKALIASSPASDLLAMHGQMHAKTLAVPEASYNPIGWQVWAETGQGRMGGPPWTAMDRYIRNSPAFAADKITAPVMLIEGDLDFDPILTTSMFMGLTRQGKDAQLLYYRGEQHVVLNPANIRDLYSRAFVFLDEAFARPDGGSASGDRADARPSQ